MANNGYPTQQNGTNWTGAGAYTAVVGAGPEGQAYQQGLRTIANQYQYQRIVQPVAYDPMTAGVGDIIVGAPGAGVNQSILLGVAPSRWSVAARVRWCPTTNAAGTVTFDVRAYVCRTGEIAPAPGSPTGLETYSAPAPGVVRLARDTGLLFFAFEVFPDDVIRLEVQRGGTYADPVEILGVFMYWEQVGPALAMLQP